MSVAFTKLQWYGPDKKESRKSVCFYKYFYGKTKWKIKVVATNIQPNGQTKRKLENEITTKI